MPTLTPEQQTILTHVTNTTGLTLINACAGSGKTTMLVSIANAIPHTNGLVLAYNKAIATELKSKFPATTHCSTTHSLAYSATVKPYKLKLGDFTYRSITEKLNSENKLLVIDLIRAFCLSEFTLFSDFSTDRELPPNISSICVKYLDLMATGQIECTHDFYLKLFHIHLSTGEIDYEPFDFVMIDEAGDINPVTLEIFKLLPATRKIAVGDPFQNIYTFNHTINAFDALASQGTLFRMTQSFRVATYIAPNIEYFCRTYLDPDMHFRGVIPASTTIKSSAYITRTNSALIARMIELNNRQQPYGLVRKATEIFRIPIMLINLKYQGNITDNTYKHLQSDVDDWYEYTNIKEVYKTPLSYISSLYAEDFPLQQAIRLIGRYGSTSIMKAYQEARRHERSDQSMLLMTAHSSKGLEVDEVTIAPDLNDSIADIIDRIQNGANFSELLPDELESLRLYYVAVTRCSVKLNNATHLTKIDGDAYPEFLI